MDWRKHYQRELRLASDRKAYYRKEAMRAHPDRGGSEERFAALQWVYEHPLLTGPCPLCEGKGEIRERKGMGVRVRPCPQCWKGGQ